jgi:hypothetical protein
MVAEAQRDSAWQVFCPVPFFGPVRVALLLATMKTPWRFTRVGSGKSSPRIPEILAT